MRNQLRRFRLARGLSQQDLADLVGVSRQAVAGIEGGAFDPSLRVSLGLAAALGTTVEALFESAVSRARVDASLVREVASLSRVDLAQVGEELVALPRHGDNAMVTGFGPAGALVDSYDGGGVMATPVRPVRPTLVVAGCDPAIPLMAGPLNRLDPPVDLAWWSCSSREALELVAAGQVQVAGFHIGSRGELATALAGIVAEPMEIFAFATWSEGLVVPGRLRGLSLSGLLESGARLVNRQPGAEARRLLSAVVKAEGGVPEEIAGWESAISAHLVLASCVARGAGDWGVASQPAAIDFGLGFTPLAEEEFLLAVPSRLARSREVRAMLRVVGGMDLRSQLSAIPGYGNIEACGRHLATV